MSKCECKQEEPIRELEINGFIGDIAYKLDNIDVLLKDLETRLDPVLRIDNENSENVDYPEVRTPLGKELLSFSIRLSNIQKSLDNITTRLEI
jgi:hypothetical protein